MLGCSNPRGVGRQLLRGSWGGFLPILSQGEAGDFLACPGYTVEWSSRPHPAAQFQRLSPLLLKLLTISVSEEVGDRAEGPRGQVPGQLLQLTQQAFDFCLQVLHRLLHRLEQGEKAEDSRGVEDKSEVNLASSATSSRAHGSPVRCSGKTWVLLVQALPAPASRLPDDKILGAHSRPLLVLALRGFA